MKTMKILLIVSIGLAMLAGCSGPKERAAQSVLDTPEYHYAQGVKFLNQGQQANAEREFNEAKSLKANFAPAYEGLALINIQKKNYKKVAELIDTSLGYDSDWVPAVVARGRLYSAQGKYEDAIDEFDDALEDIDDSKSKFDKKNVRMDALYHKAMAQKEWGKYMAAQTTLQKILVIDNTNMRASKAIRELAEYQSAVAGQSPELQKIARQKEITRADVAVLFVTELPLDKIFRKAPSRNQVKFAAPTGGIMGKKEKSAPVTENMTASDVPGNHWAKSFIDQALNKGIIELLPDGSYRPEEKVNRAEFAKLIEHFLVKAWDDPKLETQYFGTMSPYADVLNTSPVFNAVMVVSSRNIIPGKEDGTFKPLDAVNGTEALNIIRQLKSKF